MPNKITLKKLLGAIGFENADFELVSIIQSLIFAADKPLTIEKLKEILPDSEIEDIERALSAIFALHSNLGIKLNRIHGGYLFMSAPENQEFIKTLLGTKKFNLSQAALETLAIVAYLQPVTQSEINDIRGVKSESSLKLLIDRGLIKIRGRRQEPGRPLIYTTTSDFLKFFNLSTLNDLPSLEEGQLETTDEAKGKDSREILLKELLDSVKSASPTEDGIESAFEKLESRQLELNQLEEKLMKSFGLDNNEEDDSSQTDDSSKDSELDKSEVGVNQGSNPEPHENRKDGN